MKVLLRVIPAALLALALLGASPALAQCAKVQDGACPNDPEGCWVEGLWQAGSLAWPEAWPDACFESCPPPEHCPGTLASIQVTQGRLASALIEDNLVAILQAIGEPHVTFNSERGAIQFLGCDNETVIGHVSLSADEVAVLSTAQSTQNMVPRVVGF